MCVTKIHYVVIRHMLKIYLLKSQGKFKFKSGKSGKSQGIFAPEMAGNPGILKHASFQPYLELLKLNLIKLKYFLCTMKL